MKEVVFSPRAHADLDGIWEYTVENWDIEQADVYIREIVVACTAVANDKRLSRSAEDIRPGYRKIVVASHVVFYKEDSSVMDIIRVLHQRMDPLLHVE